MVVAVFKLLPSAPRVGGMLVVLCWPIEPIRVLLKVAVSDEKTILNFELNLNFRVAV